MPIKPTINLIDFRKVPPLYHNPNGGRFKVESMKNTIEFQTGTWLFEKDVLGLIKREWHVNIRHPKGGDY